MPGKEKTDGPEHVSFIEPMEDVMPGGTSTHLRPASPYMHCEASQPNRAAARTMLPAPALESDSEIAAKVLEHLDLEVFVLNATATIVFCNAAARRLLAQKANVFSHRGELCFADGEKNHWLRAQLSASRQIAEGPSMVLLPNEDPREHRLLSVHMLCGGPAGLCFITTVSRLSCALTEERVRQLMQHFGLTPAEQRLTLFLSTGRRLADAARTFRLSRHTVSNQLRSVYDKVGVRSQSELVLSMCTGPSAG